MTWNTLRERTCAPPKTHQQCKTKSLWCLNNIPTIFHEREREKHVCMCVPPPWLCGRHAANRSPSRVFLRTPVAMHTRSFCGVTFVFIWKIVPSLKRALSKWRSVRLGKQKTEIETGRDLHSPLMSGLAVPARHGLHGHLLEALRLGQNGCRSPASWPPARVEIPSSIQSTSDPDSRKDALCKFVPCTLWSPPPPCCAWSDTGLAMSIVAKRPPHPRYRTPPPIGNISRNETYKHPREGCSCVQLGEVWCVLVMCVCFFIKCIAAF